MEDDFKTELEDLFNEIEFQWDKENRRAALLKELRDLLNNQVSD